MSTNENITNGITPLQSANNDFLQEGQRHCGMGAAEGNIEISVGYGGTRDSGIFLDGEQGHLKNGVSDQGHLKNGASGQRHLKDGVSKQFVEMLKFEYPSNAFETKESARKK